MKRQEAMPVGEILRDLLKAQHLDTKLDEIKLIKLWPQMMGPTIAEYTQQIYLKNGTLYISLTSAVLRKRTAHVPGDADQTVEQGDRFPSGQRDHI